MIRRGRERGREGPKGASSVLLNVFLLNAAVLVLSSERD